MRASFTVTVSALLALGLTSCATPPPATPTATPRPIASQGAPEPVGVPGSRVPGDCDDLFPLAEAVALVGEDATRRVLRPLTASPGSAARAQSGLAECGWQGSVGDATVVALADGDSLYFGHLDAAIERGHKYSTVLSEAVGERETSTCHGDTGWSHCQVDFASNGYWVTVYFNVETSAAEAQPALAAIARGVDDRLGTLGQPLPRFEPSVTRDGAEICPAGLDPDGAVFAASGVATGFGPQDEGSGDGLPVWDAAAAQAGQLTCAWTGTSDIFFSFWLDVTPGSGWVWQEVVAAHPEGETVVVPGASHAFGYCNDTQCWVEALVGDTWMQGSLGTHPDRGLNDTVVALAAAVPLAAATLNP